MIWWSLFFSMMELAVEAGTVFFLGGKSLFVGSAER